MTDTVAPIDQAVPAELLSELVEAVGRDHVVTDPEIASGYGHDLTGRFSGLPLAVVRPAGIEQVAAVVRACAKAGVPLVPQGGHTGMVGGGTPRDGEVVLSLLRLDEIGEIDRTSNQITVGAGVTLQALQAQVRPEGYDFAVDHGGRSSATIGGMAATNAGGALAVRHGLTRSHVAGIEAVLASGEVVTHLQGLIKDNTGYDLTGLLVGSEGTLGVITRVRLRLVPLLQRRVTALLAVSTMERALEILRTVRLNVPSLQALDFFELPGLRRVIERLGIPLPFAEAYPFYVVVECAAASDPAEELECLVDLAEDAAIASDTEGRRRLWLYREAHNETINALGVSHKLDVSVPIPRLPEFVREVRAAVLERYGDAEVIMCGHLGDGNVHVNVLGVPVDATDVDLTVLELVAKLGGSIGAEHGIGVAKAEWLSLTRSQPELDAMRAIKSSLDPHGVLSPGRVLGPVGSGLQA